MNLSVSIFCSVLFCFVLLDLPSISAKKHAACHNKKIAAIEVNKVEMGTRTQKISSVMGQGAFGLVKEVHGECSRNVYQTPHDSQESDKMKNKQKKTNKKTEGRGERRN